MKKTKINSQEARKMKDQDKTDWVKVMDKSQASIDREALEDTENPILKKSAKTLSRIGHF